MQNEGVSAEFVEMVRRTRDVDVALVEPGPEETRTKPFKVAEIAAALDVHASTIYRDIESGKLRAMRVGVGRGTLRISVDAFTEYRTQLETGAATKPAGGSAA